MMLKVRKSDMFNPILDSGLIHDILVALGLVTDFEITDTYTFLYAVLVILIAIIFIVAFVRILFRAFSSIFKGVGL